MHGLGNDFIVIQDLNESLNISSLPIHTWSDRRTGIGFDQLIMILPSKKADFHCRFFNADGSEAEQCGNGIRAAARFIHEQKINQKNAMAFETQAGLIDVTINDYNTIRVNMGTPQGKISQTNLAQNIKMTTLSMGNPHAIITVDTVKSAPVATLGKELQTNTLFPQGVNVGFIEIVGPKHLRLRTFERGVGETLCCGSNACAAVVAGIVNHHLANQVTVELALGQLTIEWAGENSPVFMTGPAEKIFEGQIKW